MEYDDKEEEKDDLELLEGVVDSLCPYQKSSRICNPRWKTAMVDGSPWNSLIAFPSLS